MPPSRDDRTGRRRLRSLAAASAVASSALLGAVLPGTAAVADEPADSTVVGELVQAWAETDAHDHDHGHTAAAPSPVSWVETAGGDAVPVTSGDVAGLPAGSTVSLTLGSEQIIDGSATHPVLGAELLSTPTVAPAPAGPLTNQVTVVMAAPAGTPSGPRVDAQRIVDLVDGPVADFWADATGGAVRVGVTSAHDWITTTAGCATPGDLWNEVAAAVGFVPGPGKHLLVYIPPAAPMCHYALAEVGSSLTSGGRLYVRDTSASVIAHEIGHNFGLAHSSGRQCDGVVEGGGCRTVGYRDHYDVMGVSWAQRGSLNVVQAAYLGVLPRAQVHHLTVRSNAATVALAPVSGRTGVRALRLTDAAGVNYWLEYRPAAGRDAWLGTAADPFRLDAGVLLRRTDRFPDTSILLDGTPSRAADWGGDLQAALAVGTPVTVAGGQFTIELRGVTGDRAVLSVVATPPAEQSARTPAPAEPPAGAVLPGEATPSGIEASAGADTTGPDPAGGDTTGGDAAGVPAAGLERAPATVAPTGLAPIRGTAAPAETSLAAASEPAGSTNGLVVAGLGTALAGATTLVVRKLRRAVRR